MMRALAEMLADAPKTLRVGGGKAEEVAQILRELVAREGLSADISVSGDDMDLVTINGADRGSIEDILADAELRLEPPMPVEDVQAMIKHFGIYTPDASEPRNRRERRAAAQGKKRRAKKA